MLLKQVGLILRICKLQKGNLLSLLTTKKGNIGEEGDVKSKEELKKKCLELYNNTGGANLVSAAGGQWHGSRNGERGRTEPPRERPLQ